MATVSTIFRGSRWDEQQGEAISNSQRRELWSIAKRVWPEDQCEAEFRYWLGCNGYYVIRNKDSNTPLYSGTTKVIPIEDYAEVRHELEKFK